jgi:excisionase family DNA binding protein
MTTERLDIDALLPDPAERLAAEKLGQVLAARLAQDESFKVILSNDESGIQYDLPVTAAKLLVKILSEIAKGNAVAVVGLKPELTAKEAAELLGISHPRLIKLLESGQLPFYEVSTHHRIRLADVLAYRRRSLGERKAILREMAALNQKMGLYD